MNEIPPLTPMTREQIAENMRNLEQIVSVLKELPYRKALPFITLAEDVRISIGDQLPGGYEADCVDCGLPIGKRDGAQHDLRTGSKRCPVCIEIWNKERADGAP